MSLYRMIRGYNPLVSVIFQMMDIESPEGIPRFRDAYFKWKDIYKQEPIIVILTRTGGGNRETYESPHLRVDGGCHYMGPFNSDMRKLSGFIEDENDEFDSTYALFYYKVPEDYVKEAIDFLREAELEKLNLSPSVREIADRAIGQIVGARNFDNETQKP